MLTKLHRNRRCIRQRQIMCKRSKADTCPSRPLKLIRLQVKARRGYRVPCRHQKIWLFFQILNKSLTNLTNSVSVSLLSTTVGNVPDMFNTECRQLLQIRLGIKPQYLFCTNRNQSRSKNVLETCIKYLICNLLNYFFNQIIPDLNQNVGNFRLYFILGKMKFPTFSASDP